jgi:hypothetical protein
MTPGSTQTRTEEGLPHAPATPGVGPRYRFHFARIPRAMAAIGPRSYRRPPRGGDTYPCRDTSIGLEPAAPVPAPRSPGAAAIGISGVRQEEAAE